jgi:hypothetical protein
LESDAARACTPHRYKIVIASHTFSAWYGKTKEPDIPKDAGVSKKEYWRKMSAGGGAVCFVEEIAENEVPLSWRIVQLAWLTVISVIEKEPSFCVQRVRPIDIREARFQYQQFERIDSGPTAKMPKSRSVIHPKKFCEGIVGGVSISRSAVHLIYYEVDTTQILIDHYASSPVLAAAQSI